MLYTALDLLLKDGLRYELFYKTISSKEISAYLEAEFHNLDQVKNENIIDLFAILYYYIYYYYYIF